MEGIKPRKEAQDKNFNGLERSETSPVQTSTTPARREHRYKNMLHLWEFLLELLADERCRSIICWRRKESGEFRLMNQHEVARRWGMLKQRGGMNYGKLSRALRMYYREGIITKVKGQKLVYKFDNLPYKYEPGITRSFYRERFQKKNTSFREHELRAFQPLLPEILSTSPLDSSAFSSTNPPLKNCSSCLAIPVSSPQVCWCMQQVPCVSPMCCSKSQIFFPISSFSASRGFKPGGPALSDEANSWSPVPVSVITKASIHTKILC